MMKPTESYKKLCFTMKKHQKAALFLSLLFWHDILSKTIKTSQNQASNFSINLAFP